MGISYKDFWSMTPKIISVISEGFKQRLVLEDQQMWQFGMYIQSAVTVSIDHCLNGKKAQSEYISKPLLSEVGMTEEEQYELELQKALMIEEQWIQNDRRRGLPQTTIV